MAGVLIWRQGLRARAKQAARTTVAALASYAVGSWLGLPQLVWTVVTALIVLQVSVGATIGAGIDRMAGTLGGAVVGALVALAQPQLGLPDWAALIVAVAPLALLAAAYPRLRIAPLTAVIILLAVPPDLAAPVAALERVVEIALGTAIGLAASLLVFPARAGNFLRRHSADALTQIAWLVEAHLAAALAPAQPLEILDRQAALRRAVAAAEASAAELERERAAHVGDAVDGAVVLRSVRRLRSDAAILNRTILQPLPGPLAVRLEAPIRGLAAALGAGLRGLGGALREGAPMPPAADLDAAVAAFEQAWDEAGIEIDAALRSDETAKAALALPFAVQTLRRDLVDFAMVLAPPKDGSDKAS